MWDAYRGTRSRGGLFLSLLPLSFPLQLGVRRGAAPRLGLNASMLSQASVSPRAQRTMATKFDPRYCLAGWQWNLLSPPPSPPSAGLSFLISLHTENHLASYLGNLFRKYAKQMSFVVILYVRNIWYFCACIYIGYLRNLLGYRLGTFSKSSHCRKKEYDSRFIYRVVSEIFSRSCFGLNSIGQRCLHYVNVYATNRCSLYINFHEILSRWTIMHNSKEWFTHNYN